MKRLICKCSSCGEKRTDMIVDEDDRLHNLWKYEVGRTPSEICPFCGRGILRYEIKNDSNSKKDGWLVNLLAKILGY